MDLDHFQTTRLDLRPITECDEAMYCRLYTDENVMRHIAAPLSHEAAQRAFAKVLRLTRQTAPPLRMWVLSERGSCASLGILALIRHDDADDALELGTMLMAVGQRRGLAAESQTALLGRVFGSAPGLRLVWTRHAANNRPMASVMRKVGYAQWDSDCAQARWRMTRARWQALLDKDMAEIAGDG